MNEIDLQVLVDEYPPKRKTSNVKIKYPKEYEKLLEVTSFLPLNATTSQRIWHLRNSIFSRPVCKCPECNNKTKWFASYSDYAEYCSTKCYNKSKKILAEKRNHEKNIEKYGENYKELTTKEKTRRTNLKRYGVDNPLKDHNKIKKTNRNKYGVDYHFQSHLSETALNKLKDKEWLEKMNYEEGKNCVEIAHILGVNNATVNKAMYRLGLQPNYNYSSSFFEKQLADYIKSLNVMVLENDRNLIPPYELDIVIPSEKIAIEYCGLYWHNELHKSKDYHKNKTEFCKDVGYKLLTIFEDEWREKEEIIKSTIKYHLNKINDKIYARKCEIKEVVTKDKKSFFNETHIQGNGPSSINVGLYFHNELVACIGFIRNKNTLLLNRFSTKNNVPGAFSKLLTFVKNNYEFDRIETFADKRWSDGTLYENNGFEKTKELKPDYYYIFNNKRFHKFNFRHKKIRNFFTSYNPDKSEHWNCLEHNVFRIYDCGKTKYTLINS
jgi:very-short-patch-repair endonuclease/endogenous inhibitor of DNA gyrase (YacG/DUF329 family)